MIHIGDLHISPDRIEELKEIFNAIVAVVRENPDHDICFHGDNLNTARTDWQSAMFFADWLKSIHDITCGTVFVLQGNHDPKGDNNAYGMIETLIKSGRLVIVKKGEVRHVDSIMFLPYTLGLQETMDHIPEDVTTVCGHFSTGALLPDDPGNISADLIAANPYTLFVTGHYHRPGQYDNLLNIGSSMRWRFDEADHTKRLVITETGRLISSVDLPAWPMKEVEINSVDDLVNLASLTGFGPETIETGRYNLKLRLKARIDAETVDQFVSSAGLKMDRIETDIDSSGIAGEVAEAAISIGSMTIQDGIARHMEDGNIPETIDRVALANTIMEFYTA